MASDTRTFLSGVRSKSVIVYTRESGSRVQGCCIAVTLDLSTLARCSFKLLSSYTTAISL